MPESDIGGYGTSAGNAAGGPGNWPKPGGKNTTAVLGTNDLQKAITSFDTTVSKLEAVAEKLATVAGKMGSGGGPGGATAGDTSHMSAQATKPNTGYISGLAARFSGTSVGMMASQVGSAMTAAPFPKQGRHSDGGNGEGHGPGIASQFSGQQQQQQQQGGQGGGFLSRMAGSGGMPGGASSVAGKSPAPGMAAAGVASGVAQGGIMGGISAVASFGQASLPTQVDISSYTRSQSLFGISNFTARNRAYGANGNNINMLGQSAQDASAGQATINSLGNYGNGARYQTANAGAAGVGMANPGMSYAQDANFMAMMTDPNMSRQLNMSGIQQTMTTRGGGTNSLATTQGAIMKRLTGSTSMSQSAFNQKIGGLNTSGNKYLQQQFGGEAAAEMTSSMALQNRLEQGMDASGKSGVNKKLTDKQVSDLLQNASKSQQGSIDTLKKYGAPESDIQALQKKNAIGTATQGDISQDFTAGLTKATTALGGFDKAVEKIINLPGIKQLAGQGGGFLGTLKSFIGLAAGGVLPGYTPGKDTVPAMLSPGEGILTPEATKAVGGKSTIDALNKKHAGTRISQQQGSGGAYGFADGGVTEYDHLTHKAKHKKHKHPGLGAGGLPPGHHTGHTSSYGLPGKYADGGLVQYFSGGGYANPIRDVKNLQQQRIDQGVDYGGTGPLYPIASGTVKSTTNSGWAYCGGSAYITVDHGGRTSYYAEGITPTVKVGDHVTSNTKIGDMTGCIEVGWSASNDGQSLASQTGEWNGTNPTALGQDFSNVIAAAGGKPGLLNGLKVTGSLPSGWAASAGGSGGGAGSSSSSSSKSSSSSATASGGGASAPSGIMEAANVAAGLGGSGGGGGGGGSTKSSSSSSSSTKSNSTTAAPTVSGNYSADQLKQLWLSVGGPTGNNKGDIPTNMAGIAMAESGGNPTIKNANSTATGLWQILVGTSDGGQGSAAMKDPTKNAKQAVVLYNANTGGDHYSPWKGDAYYNAHNLASGGKVIRNTKALVGERGPELLDLPAGSTVTDAKTTAKLQNKKTSSQAFQPAPAQQVSASNGGSTYNLEFKAGSIVIGNGTGGNGTSSKLDAAHSAREFIAEVKKRLQSEDLYTSIAKGNHNA